MADSLGGAGLPYPTTGVRPLGPLLRKAATDAGFDLEPEREGEWWRLRASGASGVAWVRPTASDGGSLLALPTDAQLAALEAAVFTRGSADLPGSWELPPGAAGCVVCPSPHELHAHLRRTWLSRTTDATRLRARWDAEVASALTAAGLAPESTVIVSVDGGRPGTQPAAVPLVTEAIALVRRRIGQNLFREALLGVWKGRCAVTGLAVAELLRASHAKPWAVSTDEERLDVHNGLLLAPHLDALFDRGYLTFGDDGIGAFSPALSIDDRSALGLQENGWMLRSIHPAHRPYLAWHREHVFRAS